ncbi:hypothetical protein BD413DRAFT_492913 [Trametes elegans]|nr:hypothetical protein BD413DRAFT_492913 [Trametes elegans]
MDHRPPHNYIPFPSDNWDEPGNVGADDADDAWGDPGAGADWEDPGAGAHTAGADDWGAPSGGDWGMPTAVDNNWGAHAPASPGSMNGGYGGQPRKSSLKKSGAHSHPQQSAHPPPAQAPAHTSFHPSAAAHMASSHFGAQHAPQDWGAPATAGWEDSGGWGPPPPPPPKPSTTSKPAWANWANEARGIPTVNTQPATTSHPYRGQNTAAAPAGGGRPALSDQQRSQILSSLLQAPNQYTKDYLSQTMQQATRSASGSRPQQSFNPNQQWDAQVLAEQQGILRSLQESSGHGRSHHAQQGHPQPVQQADSWGNYMGGGWGERASTIPEEDEYEDEEDEWGDAGGAWGTGQTTNGRVRFSPDVSYLSSPRKTSSHSAPGQSASAAPRRHSSQGNPQQFWTPTATASKTMKMATGSISTTVFELPPPRNGMGEMGFVDSRGTALKPAERALYSRERPAKLRFRWGFNPDKDPRVGSLLRWIASTSNGLATLGLHRFLETGERGALFANADFRVPSAEPGGPAHPAFDWVTMDQIQRTLDATLQESVALYDPAFQVIVFVFLLSPSGNSMALWRRKLNVPDSVREANHDNILAVKAELKDYPVYVDE